MPLPLLSLLPLAFEYVPKLLGMINNEVGEDAEKVAQVIKNVVGTTDINEARKVLQDPEKVIELQREINDTAIEMAKIGAGVVTAEIKSDSWLAKNWRPMTMMVFVFIIFNNFVLAPYANAIFGAGTLPILDTPPDLWALIKIGLGGYVVGRSVEKGIGMWKK